MSNKETAKNARVDAKDTKDALEDAPQPKVMGDDGTDGRIVAPESAPAVAEGEQTEEQQVIAEALPVEPVVQTPSEVEISSVGQGLVPSPLTPQPNVTRDAEAIALEKAGVESFGVTTAPSDSVRADEDATGPRDARDLAALIRAYPAIVNQIDHTDEFERAMGIKEPAPWVANPVLLLEEAKRYNVSFIGPTGNIVATSH